MTAGHGTNIQYRNRCCTHPSLSLAGVGYRGLVIGVGELRPLGPIILGRRGRDLQQLCAGQAVGCGIFGGRDFGGT